MKLKPSAALTVLLFLLLFWGGMGISLPATATVGLVASGIMLTLAFAANGSKLNKPLGFYSYLAFLAVISASFLRGGLGVEGKYFLALFLGGGAFWLGFYNLQKSFSGKLTNIIILLGVIFGVMLVGYMLLGEIPVRGWNLYLFSSIYRNHNHIGDLWALVEIVAVYRIIKTKKWYWWALGLAGIFFLAVSLSRSAYVAFFAGAAFLTFKEKWSKKYSKLLIPVLVAPVLLFLGAGLFKTTLYSRLYFLQGLLGLFRHPLGVGLGNFAQVSNEAGNILSINAKAALAHNIVLEVVVGVGVLGIFFIVWLLKVLVDLFKRGDILYSALFVALTVNFFFDTTYYIPAMIWLWFVLLGLAQARK